MVGPTISFSHMGLFVRDIDLMASFYQEALNLVVTDRGDLPGRTLVFMSSDPREHHQVVLATGRTGELTDKVVNQISFRVGSLEELQECYRRLQEMSGVSDFRCINHGTSWTLYFRDPELNRLELFADAPWYIAQPVAEPLDLTLPAEEIRTATLQMCQADPTFEPIESWRARLAAKIEKGRATQQSGAT
jgi:catechol 2,3-dioxygenase